jgi:hypothetical protein
VQVLVGGLLRMILDTPRSFRMITACTFTIIRGSIGETIHIPHQYYCLTFNYGMYKFEYFHLVNAREETRTRLRILRYQARVCFSSHKGKLVSRHSAFLCSPRLYGGDLPKDRGLKSPVRLAVAIW